MKLDHIAITADRLEDGAAWAEDLLGVPPVGGGTHEYFGTHNRLWRLGDLYLEVIAPDPAASVPRARWFGLDHVRGAPRLAAWIAKVDNLSRALEEAPGEVGAAVALTRGDLSWSIAVPEDGSVPMGGALPMLIEWGPGGHPLDVLRDDGLRLVSLEVAHPEVALVKGALSGQLEDARVQFATADRPGLAARITRPDGREVVIGS